MGWVLRACPLVLVLACLAVLKAYGLHPQPGDEGIYFYLAGRVAQAGVVPYRDFFFAHPPVHLLVAAGAFKALGATLPVAKAIAPAAALATVAITYATCARRLGVLPAFVAAALLLTSYDFLRASSHFTGVNVTLALATGAAGLALSGRSLAAGAVAALAVSAGLYAAPTALGCGIVLWLGPGGWRRLLRFAGGFAAVAALVDGGFWWAAGDAFVDQVWRYHIAKPGQAWAGAAMGGRVLLDNLGPTLGAGLALLALAAGRLRTDQDRTGLLALLLGLGNLAVLSSLQRAFPFYFLMALPGLAVAGGYAAGRAYLALGRLLAGELRAGAGLALAGAALWGGLAQADALRREHIPQSLAAHDTSYWWADAEALPAWLNEGVRKLAWQDRRAAGEHYGGVRRYLWHESRRWPLLMEVAAHVDAVAAPDAPLFGDSLTAPYLAFLTGRPVAADEADTNAARFRSGAARPDDVIRRVEDAGVAFVIARPGRGWFRLKPFRTWAEAGWRIDRAWPEPGGGRLLLLRPR